MIAPIILAASLALSLQASAAAMPSDQQAISQQALSQENTALLRCSAAFALISHGQENGNDAALQWPRLDVRGREFFVRALAQLMDETGRDRDGISHLVSVEAQRLVDNDEINRVMPACLVMLEASGV